MNIHGHKRSQPPVFMEKTAIAAALTTMERNSLLNTSAALVEDELGGMTSVTFKEKHLVYLQKHPKVDPKTYLANLRTMIKIR